MLISKILVRFHKWVARPYNYVYNSFLLAANGVSYGKGLKLGGRLLIRNRGRISIGSSVTITSSRTSNPVGGQAKTIMYASPGAQVVIGSRSSLSNVIIFSQDSIAIGEDVMLGGGVQIYDSNFHSTDFVNRVARPDPDIRTAPVVIEKGAFVGTCSIIMKGVSIGEYSLIAAGSVVVSSVPAREIWGGNPAKFIKKLEN